MKRLLYLFPEEWTGGRARELHTLQTCLALADAGADVTLIVGAGFNERRALAAVGRHKTPKGFHSHIISRRLLLIRSWRLFAWKFRSWLGRHGSFDMAYVIHLKAVPVVRHAGIPFWWEAHEVFAESAPAGSAEEKRLDAMEREAVKYAEGRIATSGALAKELVRRYGAPDDFHIVSHGTLAPVPTALNEPEGPLVYAGSLANWKGLDLALEAAARVKIPVRIIGGNQKEWQQFVRNNNISPEAQANVRWKPRVAPDNLPERLSGCRAGLSPTRPESASGRFSLPMKLYDYARSGLPAICTELPSLKELGTESWCRLVPEATVDAWAEAMSRPLGDGEAALEWAREHTWERRGATLARIMGLVAVPDDDETP